MLHYPTKTDRIGLNYLQYYAAGNVYHSGIDFNWGPLPESDHGQAVVCPTWGIVEYVSEYGTNGGLGNYVVVYHPHNSAWTRYLHLDSIKCSVKETVAPNQLIGTLGNSGTTSSHLHFEVLTEKGRDWIRDYRRPYGRYPTGYSRDAVKTLFADPVAWLKTQEHYVGLDNEKKLRQAENAIRWASGMRLSMLRRLIERLKLLLGVQ